MATTYTIIWRQGGRENFRWQRSLTYSQRVEAAHTARDLERMGYVALVHETARLDAIGLPETYE